MRVAVTPGHLRVPHCRWRARRRPASSSSMRWTPSAARASTMARVRPYGACNAPRRRCAHGQVQGLARPCVVPSAVGPAVCEGARGTRQGVSLQILQAHGDLGTAKEQLLLRSMLPSGGGRRGSGRRGRLTGQRAPRAVHGGRGRRGRLTGARRAGGDNEVQRTMLEIVNQLDGFDSRGNIKARAPRRPPGPPRPRPCSPVGARRLRVARGRAGQPPARPGAVPEPACLPGGRACVAAE